MKSLIQLTNAVNFEHWLLLIIGYLVITKRGLERPCLQNTGAMHRRSQRGEAEGPRPPQRMRKKYQSYPCKFDAKYAL